MSADDRLHGCAVPALRDVAVTTALRLDVSLWEEGRADIGFAVHQVGTVPHKPVWETFRLLEKGANCIALHPFPTEDPLSPGDGDHNELVILVADGVQQMTQMLLWQAGSDPTWPPCPAHPGGHDLRIAGRCMSWSMQNGLPRIHEDTGAAWICPRGDFSTPVGQLKAMSQPNSS